MKNLVLFVDSESNTLKAADILRRRNSIFMYERYDDYGLALRRIVQNNFDTMVISLDMPCNVKALVRANYNIGKSTIVRYSCLVQKLKFMLSNLDILDSVEFICNIIKPGIVYFPVMFTELFIAPNLSF